MSPFTSLDMDQSGPSFSSLREAEERLPPVASDDPSTSPGTSSRATSQCVPTFWSDALALLRLFL